MLHARPFTTDHLERLLHDLRGMLANDEPFSLIMIDSIMGLFRTEFNGRGKLDERQQVLGRV